MDALPRPTISAGKGDYVKAQCHYELQRIFERSRLLEHTGDQCSPRILRLSILPLVWTIYSMLRLTHSNSEILAPRLVAGSETFSIVAQSLKVSTICWL
jgi:hypothetical protein